MRRHQLARFLGFVALGVVALYTVGSLASSGGGVGGGAVGVSSGEQASVPPDEVMAEIDAVLGRPSTGSQEKAAGTDLNALNIKPAPRAGESAAAPPQPESAPQATIDDRKIVQTASLALQVREVGAAFEEVGRIAAAAGGFVVSSRFSYQDTPVAGQEEPAKPARVQVASLTIRVPAARYQEVLGQLRDLGVRVDSETSNASDITEQYSDLQARLRNLEATEAQLLQLLSRASTIGEVLQVQDRLGAVRTEIDQVKGRLNLLERLSDLATITVHLRPEAIGAKAEGGTKLGRAVSEAWEASIDFLGDAAAVVVTGVVFLWWLPIVAVPAYGAWRSLARRRSAAAQG